MPRFEIEWDGAAMPAALSQRLQAELAGACDRVRLAEGISDDLVVQRVVPSIVERMRVFRGPEGERHMTRTGRVVNRFAPQAEDWDLDSLAWSQANLCRYGGEVHVLPGPDGRIREHAFYSTAEHQLNAMKAVDIVHPGLPARERARLRLYAGVHDFVEVRLSDLISDIKRMIPDAKAYEHSLEDSFFPSIGLDPQMPPEIDAIDKRLVMNEGPAVFPGTDIAFWRARTKGREPIPGIVVPDPRFVVEVPVAPEMRDACFAPSIRMWSFPPLVAAALLREIRAAQAELGQAAA